MIEQKNANKNQPREKDIDSPQEKRKRSKRRLLIAVFSILAVTGIVVGVPIYHDIASHESTDDAFVNGQIIAISPRVSGHVATVHVQDNQKVKAGDLLLEIDPSNFQARLDEDQAMVSNAEAMADAAESKKAEVQAQLAVAQAALKQSRAELLAILANYDQSSTDLKRYKKLAASNTISPQQLDHATTAERMAAAQFEAAQSKVTTQQSMLRKAEAAINSADDNVRQAKAQVAARLSMLEQAGLNLSYTRIYAPNDGYVTKKSVEPGAFIQVGQSLMAIVSTDVWVTANFKETQLTHIRPGQPVTISIDTFPGVTFQGHVDSIQHGTGAKFSLLPPENATGNFVKVVQRIPVKIVFENPEALSRYFLVPGMSAVPEVNIRDMADSDKASKSLHAAE